MKLLTGILSAFYRGGLMNNQKGMILISLLIMIIVLSILSIGVYSISYSVSRQTQFIRDNAQAYYIAKAGADLVISDIEKIKEKMEKNNQVDTTFNIEFSNEGKATVDVKMVNEDDAIKEIHIKSIGLVKEGKLFESKNKIQARLINNGNLNGIRIVLGVGSDGNIYEFDDCFELISPDKASIKKPDNIKDPRSFAWNGSDKLVLIGGESGKNDTAIYDLNTNEWIYYRSGGNGLRYIVCSDDKNSFYVIHTNNDKVLHLVDNEWKDLHKLKGNFNIEKLAKGKNILIGISTMTHDYVAYKQTNEDWLKKNTNIYGIYNSITYGNGMFVIVGSDTNDNENGHPLIIYSEDGVNWNTGDIITDGTGYPLYDIIWTGENLWLLEVLILYIHLLMGKVGVDFQDKIFYILKDQNITMILKIYLLMIII